MKLLHSVRGQSNGAPALCIFSCTGVTTDADTFDTAVAILMRHATSGPQSHHHCRSKQGWTFLTFKRGLVQVHLVLLKASLTYCNCFVYHLSAGTLAVGGGNIRSKADVAHVAGSLIRSALPMHFHITVNGGRI